MRILRRRWGGWRPGPWSCQEFKREPKDRDAIRKAICALANDLGGKGGGDLLIGVDRNGSPYPVDSSDEALTPPGPAVAV